MDYDRLPTPGPCSLCHVDVIARWRTGDGRHVCLACIWAALALAGESWLDERLRRILGR